MHFRKCTTPALTVFAICLAFCPPAALEAQEREPPGVDAYFEERRDSVPLNQRIQYRIELHWRGAGELKIVRPPEPYFSNLQLLSSGQEGSARPEADERTLCFTFELQPQAEGPAYAGQASLQYQFDGAEQPQTLGVERVNILVTPKRYNVWGWLRNALLALLALAALGAFVLLGTARRRPGGKHHEPQDEAVTALERFQSELALLKRKLEQGDFIDLFEKAEKWLRGLLSRASGSNLRTATPPEIRRELAALNEAHPQIAETAQAILEQCETVKYAGHRPDAAEKELLYKNCEKLLNDMQERRVLHRS